MPYPGKLSHWQRVQLCAWLAVGDSPSQVAAKCEETFGVRISPENVYQNYLCNNRWKKVIARFRGRFQDRIADIPIAHKYVRLRRLDDAVNHCLLWQTREVRDRKGRLLGVIRYKQIEPIPRLVREARREVEGHQTKIGTDSAKPQMNLVEVIKEAAELRKTRQEKAADSTTEKSRADGQPD